MGDALLFCSSRVHNRGANAIGQYDIYVKTVLLILFEGFTNMLKFVGFFSLKVLPTYLRLLDFFPFHSNCLDMF